MIIWADDQLSPSIATWITANFAIEAVALREIGLRDVEDIEIFHEARNKGSVIMTKDADFVALVGRLGPPLQIIWLTCSNTSNLHLREILSQRLGEAVSLIEAGEPLVEINSPF